MTVSELALDLWIWSRRAFWLLLIVVLASGSTAIKLDQRDRVRRYARQEEFDFAGWTLDALGLKLEQYGLGASAYLTDSQRRDLVLEYVARVQLKRRNPVSGILAI